MHIGVNTLFFIPGKVGGSETYLKETLRELVALRDVELTLFTNRENDSCLRSLFSDQTCPAKIHFNLLDFKAENRVARILREQLQLPARIRESGCEILWSPGYTSCLFTCCPQVVSVLDMQYRRFPADLTFVARMATDILVRLGVRKCRRVIAISEFSKREIAHFTSADESKIDVTPLGVARDFRQNSHQQTPLPLSVKQPYILCVAGSYPHKNLPALVEAFTIIADKTPYDLVIVGGKGLGEKALAETIAASKAKYRIKRASGLSTSEVSALYSKASLFVLPSLYEGFGLPVVEAQLAGIPVVSTDSASIPEVAGDAAILCDGSANALAKAIQRVMAMSASERLALTDKGVRNALRFTWSQCAELTLSSLHKAFHREMDVV